MRRISTCNILALFTLLVVCVGSAQQPPSSPNLVDGPVLGGDGTPYYIPIWRTNSYLLSSVIYQTSAGSVGIGTAMPAATLDVNGGVNAATTYSIGGKTVLSVPAPGNLDVGMGVGQSGSFNTLLGWEAGRINSGSFNVFIGPESGWLSPGGLNNIGIGYQAGLTVAGNGNVMLGGGTGGQVTSGSDNTFLGNNAGPFTSTGSNNVYIGNGAGAGETSHAGNNNILISNAGTSYDTNTIRIGDPSFQSAAYIAGIYGVNIGGLPVQINASGQLGAPSSSSRFKEQVRDMGESTSALMKLRPVTFLYKPEYASGERTLQYGLIAEEVAKVYPELVAYDKDGQPYSVRYQYITTMLLNEVQKQYRRAQSQAEVIKAQQQEIETLEQRLTRLETLVGASSAIQFPRPVAKAGTAPAVAPAVAE